MKIQNKSGNQNEMLKERLKVFIQSQLVKQLPLSNYSSPGPFGEDQEAELEKIQDRAVEFM